MVVSESAHDVVCQCHGSYSKDTVRFIDANARLIAAAPQLLAALKLLVSNAATSPSTSEGVKRLRTAVDVARAAIAAAEPEAPHREAAEPVLSDTGREP